MFLQKINSNDFKITSHIYLWALSIFILNVLFKLIDVSYSPFWYDEIISIKAAYQDFGHIKHTSEWDNNPPFYYYCLSIWIKCFNDSEFTVRLLSIIFSSVAAVYLFLIANKNFNLVTAICASFIFLSNNIVFYYSHEARAYSLVLMLSLVSTWLYFNLKSERKIKYIIWLGLINFLIIYSHYIAGLVLFFQTVLMLFYFDKELKKYFSYSLLITIALTLLRFTKKQFLLIFNFNSPKNSFWLPKSTFEYLKEVTSSFLFNDYFAIIFLVIIFLIVVITIIKKTPNQFFIIYSFCLGIGSVLILYFLGKLTPIFLDRYLIFSIPFLSLLIASGTLFIKNNYVFMSGCFLFFCFAIFKISYKTDKNMDYRSVVNFIKNEKKSNDLIIVKTKDMISVFGYYYEKDFLRNKKNELDKTSNIISCSEWQDVSIDVTKFQRIFVVDSYQDYNKNEQFFVNELSKLKTNYFVTNYFKGVKISVYQ